jgi:hypothetical protein
MQVFKSNSVIFVVVVVIVVVAMVSEMIFLVLYSIYLLSGNEMLVTLTKREKFFFIFI